MEYLIDAVFTSSVAIPNVPSGSGEPGRVWTQDGELRVRSEVEADDHASAAAAAVEAAVELVEFRYGAEGMPKQLELGELRVRTISYVEDHMPGLPSSWMTATDIARYTGRSLSQVMQSIVTKAGFPEPISTASGRSSRLWPVAETKVFLDEWLDRVGRR
ncbi:hypothetical protein AB0B28_20020 [Glycomyces sp. NPDC046736]|uniref:hypothetical protein n=1 Tax=Glycomyces sp. NPDC046736 TaxID=3155615 RepID=UPI0033C3C806